MPHTELRTQTAALPVIKTKDGALRVLMITSRDTGRWVMPKGWPMEDKSLRGAAAQEALEEAGVIGKVSKEPLGTYTYLKRMDDEADIPVEVVLYPMKVTKLLRNWPERDERKRKWFSPKGAAKRVDEPDLQALLKDLQTHPKKAWF